jgi:hypothetical protein
VALKNGHLRGFGQIIRDQTDMKRTDERVQTLNLNLTRTVQELRDSQAALREKLIELEQFEEAVVGRELKMITLERELEQAKNELARLKQNTT